MKVRKEKGFTLVEVIVVAVIVAVLAAVAIPLYMGYIKDSRINVGNNVAGSISGAAGASTQQKVVFTVVNAESPDDPAAPLVVTFPSVNDPGVTDNTIIVPNSYTIAWSDGNPGHTDGGPGTVEVYYTDYGQGTGKVFTYKQ
ncbi:MAG: prepilin-type N-terminal cleavage/methylation domain-containing protein [Chitinispirillaceae bacterium]|nr:prepilin-type N-terminal cleavage/methylation domain-containing protein [Chitinispirillaceae bacterium]